MYFHEEIPNKSKPINIHLKTKKNIYGTNQM